MPTPFYAHTHPDSPDPKDAAQNWEPLFTPFGDGNNECQRDTCKKCTNIEPQHGHLNKVAHLTSSFAAEMFPLGSDRASARQWGKLNDEGPNVANLIC